MFSSPPVNRKTDFVSCATLSHFRCVLGRYMIIRCLQEVFEEIFDPEVLNIGLIHFLETNIKCIYFKSCGLPQSYIKGTELFYMSKYRLVNI